jgi:hypothetical protein
MFVMNTPELHSRSSLTEGRKQNGVLEPFSFPGTGMTNATPLRLNFESLFALQNLFIFQRKISLSIRTLLSQTAIKVKKLWKFLPAQR